MSNPRKLRTPQDYDRFKMAMVSVDQAFFASETKWGVGRLERIVSLSTLQAYRRGWDAYRVALDDCDGEALEQIGPRMIQALAFMDGEASAAGHQPLAPDTWEAALPDGRVIVVCRTSAEASAVLRASKGRETVSYETTLPPDLAITVRNQHEGRALVVVTMAEVARLLVMAEGKVAGIEWEGTATYSGRQMDEQAGADLVRTGYPLPEPIAADLGF